MKKTFSLFLILFAFFLVSAASFTPQEPGRNYALEKLAKEQHWVDSLYNALTEDERLGQLVWLRAHSDKGDDHVAQVERLIKKYHAGGLCWALSRTTS